MSLVLASRATVYDRYAISRRFTAQETAINIVQGHIALLVSASEIEELKNGNKTMYSRLSTVEVNLNSITLAVSSSEYKDINGVLNAITQARASITVNAQQIELKVSKNSIISSINQSAEAVQIAANKIALTGNGVIDILNSGTTTISATRINLNGIVTANGNFKILADGSMEAKNGKFLGSVTVGGIQNDRISILNSSGIQIGRWDNKGIYAENCVFNYAVIGTDNFQVDFSGGRMTLYADWEGKKDWYAHILQSWVVSDPGYLGMVIKAKHISMSIEITKSSGTSSFDVITGSWNYANNIGTVVIGRNQFNHIINVRVAGNFSVTGTKNRIVKTKNFGTIAQSSYETAEPMFGDMGHGVINEFGKCVIFIDPKFAETVSTECGYYVFITKYSDGDAWVSEKGLDTFTISGTPGLEFDWEIKAHQKGYEYDRLKQVELPS